MFNIKQHKSNNAVDLILNELGANGIVRNENNTYRLSIGDEKTTVDTLNDCRKFLRKGIAELKDHLRETWDDLSHLADAIIANNGENNPSLDNLLFLNSVKKSFLLSRMFSQLADVSLSIKKLFYVNPNHIDQDLIQKFTHKYLQIRSAHYLVMNETYRLRLINRYMQVTKTAQVSGPWANLDLPMKERVWEWDEGEEEYFGNRDKARKEQIRYNPELDKYGFYFVWQDLTRDPYKFEDMKKDSPYKSRHLMSIP